MVIIISGNRRIFDLFGGMRKAQMSCQPLDVYYNIRLHFSIMCVHFFFKIKRGYIRMLYNDMCCQTTHSLSLFQFI